MKLDQDAVDEFKDYIVQSMNDDIYYQLKAWINHLTDTQEEYSEAMSYFLHNINGSLQWDETQSYRPHKK